MTNKTSNNFAENIFKSFGDFKAPQVDMSVWADAGRRNMEAFAAANQALVQGSQEAAKRQTEIVRNNIEASIKASKEIFSGKTPETNTAKQTEFVRASFENAISNNREIAELASKANNKACDIINKRTSESLKEFSKVSTAA